MKGLTQTLAAATVQPRSLTSDKGQGVRLSKMATPAPTKSNDLLLHLLLTVRMQQKHMPQQHKLHPDEVGLLG